MPSELSREQVREQRVFHQRLKGLREREGRRGKSFASEAAEGKHRILPTAIYRRRLVCEAIDRATRRVIESDGGNISTAS